MTDTTGTAARRASIAVIGGGYAGTFVARALDADHDVILIEPRDVFIHNVALLRSLVDPDFVRRIAFPYDKLLARGRVIRDRVVGLREGRIVLVSGAALTADFIIVATGSQYPFPAKPNVDNSTGFFSQLTEAHEELARAAQPLLLGAGPVGVELAGEIVSAWPDKKVTLIDPANDVLGGKFHPELRQTIRQQLEERGVSLVLGDSLPALPDAPSASKTSFVAETTSGQRIEADIWFKCYGGAPNVDYLADELKHLKTASGHLRVDDTLRLAGCRTLFAVGDVTDITETKRAGLARFHSAIVVQNIADIVAGRTPSARYIPAPERMVVPIGPEAGGGYDGSGGGHILGPEEVARDKGHDLKTEGMERLFGPPIGSVAGR